MTRPSRHSSAAAMQQRIACASDHASATRSSASAVRSAGTGGAPASPAGPAANDGAHRFTVILYVFFITASQGSQPVTRRSPLSSLHLNSPMDSTSSMPSQQPYGAPTPAAPTKMIGGTPPGLLARCACAHASRNPRVSVGENNLSRRRRRRRAGAVRS